MNIYIPNIQFDHINKKDLFILVRPFLCINKWGNDFDLKQEWNISEEFKYVNTIEIANVFIIPKPIQYYSKKEIWEINEVCKRHNIKAYGYVPNDFGPNIGNYSHITFFRMSGFKSQLGDNNKGFPVGLSDHFQRIYQKEEIDIRQKQKMPVVGFCGHASDDFIKRIKENLKFVKENLNRFFQNPFRSDYETLFPSAYYRAKLLQYLENSPKIRTDFIFRKHYRGGAVTKEQREQTTLEYYDNINNSDYVLCVRGAGNFSVRFYETLLMGRIPVFVNTDCLLPFENEINWKDHVVWIDWNDRNKIAELVSEFHHKLTDKQFEDLQKSNRNLWKERLSINAMLHYIKNDI